MLVAGVLSLPSSEVSSVGVATEETGSLIGAVTLVLRRDLLPLADGVMDGAGDGLMLARREALVERLAPLPSATRLAGVDAV